VCSSPSRPRFYLDPNRLLIGGKYVGSRGCGGGLKGVGVYGRFVAVVLALTYISLRS